MMIADEACRWNDLLIVAAIRPERRRLSVLAVPQAGWSRPIGEAVTETVRAMHLGAGHQQAAVRGRRDPCFELSGIKAPAPFVVAAGDWKTLR
jgi:hypothetical protein